MKVSRYIILMCAVLGITYMQAQVAASYTCNFEDSIQNKTWVLENGYEAKEVPNKWFIGSAINNGGAQCLYITADTGRTAGYVAFSSVAVAYTDITLDAGTYDIAFDWCALGYSDGAEGLYVAWAPDELLGSPVELFYNKSATLTDDMKRCALPEQGEPDCLAGSGVWKTYRTKITSDGKHHRLAFYWVTNSLYTVFNPGACVDNISIIHSGKCPIPTSLKTTKLGNQRIQVDWEGTSPNYEVRCYAHTTKTWSTQVVSDTTAIFSGIPDGVCDFYVSALCEDSLKSISAQISEFLYDPNNHCIDYLTLDSTNCFVSDQSVQGTAVADLTWSPKKVDYGYASQGSRHTIHTRQDEMDPRTCGGLKTVPDGEIASVRLGNWNTGGEAERIEYKFHVDASVNPVLVLKYAVVLQKPGETCHPNPGFLLRVLDKNGRLVSKCASADFDFKAAAAADWNACTKSIEVRWKDWTTVGVNLADYDGETLTVQLTTYDCGGGGHYGYAYFTLGCSDGQLSGMSCATENLKFTAPDGFNYRWYKVTEPTKILGRQQTFEVTPNDTCHYKVDLMFAQDSTCYFSLTASAQPYQPVAKATYKRTPHDCINEVQFTNVSYVKETNQITGEETNTGKPVDWILWDFGDGTTSFEHNPTHVFSNSGQKMNVKLIAHISTCVDTLHINDYLPAIGTQYDTIPVQQCFGTDYTYTYTDSVNQSHIDTLTESGLYTYMLKAYTGCDSLVTINLNMTDTLYTLIDTLIMRDETYTVGNQTFSETGVYRIPLIATSGCDSVVTLKLRVYNSLKVTGDTLLYACHGDPSVTYNYRFTQGWTNLYSLIFEEPQFTPVHHDTLHSETELDILLPTTLHPDKYHGQMTFVDSISGDVTIPFVLELRYNSEVLTQRWNDVLAVRNEEYNGGFEFVGYQWYKDGQPIEGATESYYYVQEGLDAKAEYSALLTRAGDSLQLMTCAIVPQLISEMEVPNVPTLVEKGKRVPIIGRYASSVNGVARWMTIYGVVIDEQTILGGEGIYAPHLEGMYLLTIQDEKSRQTTYHVVVK